MAGFERIPLTTLSEQISGRIRAKKGWRRLGIPEQAIHQGQARSGVARDERPMPRGIDVDIPRGDALETQAPRLRAIKAEWKKKHKEARAASRLSSVTGPVQTQWSTTAIYSTRCCTAWKRCGWANVTMKTEALLTYRVHMGQSLRCAAMAGTVWSVALFVSTSHVTCNSCTT